MFYFSKKSLNLLNNKYVHPQLKLLFMEAIKDSPIDFTIIETVRTLKQQRENLKKGVSKTLKSRHIPEFNKSGLCEAVDAAPYPIDWKNTERFKVLAKHIKLKASQLGINITWGGDWKTLIDMPHYQLK